MLSNRRAAVFKTFTRLLLIVTTGTIALATELSPRDIAFGNQQVQKMLADRPLMRRLVKPSDSIYSWTSRQFAGEQTKEKIYWKGTTDDPLPPQYVAFSTLPGPGICASINLLLLSVNSLGLKETTSNILFK